MFLISSVSIGHLVTLSHYFQPRILEWLEISAEKMEKHLFDCTLGNIAI
jgi:hypothetical protein